MKTTSADISSVRAERLGLWTAAAGSRGLVSVGNVAWLLDVSTTRAKFLVAAGRLTFVSPAGQRMVHFASVLKYARANKLRQSRTTRELPAMPKIPDQKTVQLLRPCLLPSALP